MTRVTCAFPSLPPYHASVSAYDQEFLAWFHAKERKTNVPALVSE